MQGTALYALLHMRRYKIQLSPPKPITFRKKMDNDPSELTTITLTPSHAQPIFVHKLSKIKYTQSILQKTKFKGPMCCDCKNE